MNDNLFIQPNASILDALGQIDTNSCQILLVIDKNKKFIGLLTDGDLRRGLLRGGNLQQPIADIVNTKPLTANTNQSRSQILSFMRERKIHHLPVVDGNGAVVSLHTIDEIIGAYKCENPVVLMAGGLGMRLRPLTENTPKPMIHIGGKPILHRILDHLKSHGFYKFAISVNYKSEIIEEYFGNGENFNCHISYIRETERMGTAGSLSLWNEPPQCDFMVMNGDILTNFDATQFRNIHCNTGALATMAVREYSHTIPFGVIKQENGIMTHIEEKPTHKDFINTGIYMANPTILKTLQRGQYLDMPNLLQQFPGQVRITPLRDYWLDIGRFEDLNKAELEYQSLGI